MSQISDANYIVISGWMINRLGLSGTELIVFAIIYGFCQHDSCNGSYHGSLQYLADFTGTTKPTVIRVLKSLAEKGYIEKSECYQNNVKFCSYSISLPVVENLTGSKETLPGSKISLPGGSKETLPGGSKISLPNNKTSDNKSFDNKIINKIQEVVELYNSICISYPTVQKMSERRKSAIKARLQDFTLEEIKKAFTNAENSDFLKGKNDRGWRASFDWLMNENNLAKVLEGNYDNKKGSDKNAGSGNIEVPGLHREHVDTYEQDYLAVLDAVDRACTFHSE